MMTTPNTNTSASLSSRSGQGMQEHTKAPTRTLKPRVDIYENEREFLVIADVPGARAEVVETSTDVTEVAQIVAAQLAVQPRPTAPMSLRFDITWMRPSTAPMIPMVGQ